MTYDIYRYIFIGAAMLSVIMFVASILIFIFLKIPKVISDLSGATAKKAIKNIREQNEASGDKGYKVSALNQARGKLTDKISPSGNIVEQYHSQMAAINTTKIETQMLVQDNETTVLHEETTVLDNQKTGETTVLVEELSMPETSVLSETEENNINSFFVECDITFINTNEIIEAEALI